MIPFLLDLASGVLLTLAFAVFDGSDAAAHAERVRDMDPLTSGAVHILPKP